MNYQPIKVNQKKFFKDLAAMIALLQDIEQSVAQQAIEDLQNLKLRKGENNV